MLSKILYSFYTCLADLAVGVQPVPVSPTAVEVVSRLLSLASPALLEGHRGRHDERPGLPSCRRLAIHQACHTAWRLTVPLIREIFDLLAVPAAAAHLQII